MWIMTSSAKVTLNELLNDLYSIWSDEDLPDDQRALKYQHLTKYAINLSPDERYRYFSKLISFNVNNLVYTRES